jgi:hypothetical protein
MIARFRIPNGTLRGYISNPIKSKTRPHAESAE